MTLSMRAPSRRQPSAKPDVSDPDSIDSVGDSIGHQPLDPEKESRRRAPLSPRNQAMNWLARREYSRAELSAKLITRDHSPEDVEVAVAGLVADGLVSDERFAESFVAVRVRKGQGPVRIRMGLKQRGVDPDTIRLYLDDAGLDWHTLVREVRSRKYGEVQPRELKEKARQMRFLEYRGFTGDQIRIAVDEDN
jgi:regulatory protein